HHPKPDLRRSGHLPRGTSGVRIEFIVSSDRVLLSDFEAWHAVLNCWYLSLSEVESDNWDNRCEIAGIKIGWENWHPPSPKEELMRSWERIFDLKLLKKHSAWMGGGAIHACIEKIYMDEVVTVTYFI
ncbi:hypothetical protein C5S30_01900, partial [ANME-1 cluster archaeon GoMg4]|nr:hypothetical protein [ANME-1 cluster archaeon GoMg4]